MSNKGFNCHLNSKVYPNRPNPNLNGRPGLHQGNSLVYLCRNGPNLGIQNMYASVVYSMCQENIAFALSEQPVTLAHPPFVSQPSADPLSNIHKNHKCTVPSPLAAKNKDDKAHGVPRSESMMI